jgi:H+/gluconate symporter-like permease
VGLFGILLGLVLLVWLAYRGWSILLLAPAAALIAAAFAGGPLLAYWTQTFMDSASRFVAQFFPLFLLGALFGKLMEDSGSVSAIAQLTSERLGPARAILTVVLAGALVTYGGVSLFVAFFVLVPMAQALFRSAALPNRLIPATIALGTSTFTMSALPGTPAIQNAIPIPFFGTTPLAAPGLGIIASAIMLAFGLWWLGRAAAAVRNREGSASAFSAALDQAVEDETVRQRATTAREFDPREVHHGHPSRDPPPIGLAALPLLVVVIVNVLMTLVILPRLDVSFLAKEEFGATSLSAVAGGPLVSLAVATNLLAALTGSASGGLTIALEALAGTYMRLAAEHGIDPALLHRIAVLSAGTLDSLPQNGAVVTLLAVCGSTHRESYFDIVMAAIVGPIIALAAVIALGSLFGSF